MAMVPHDEPVEKAIKAESIKVNAGNICGATLIEIKAFEIKSAV